ncbi:MAG: response regulator transcription factor, partial [Bacteroidota bacterium]|nr:response regulator transcription factor [Bacteroidota bacterium]
MIWKCLIADDEPPAVKIIEKYISRVDELQLVGTCQNAFEVIRFLKTESVNLIFLDIHMPKLSGIGLINSISEPPKIIFTTAYKEYASNAFEMDAIDYLIKPIPFERFLKAVNKLPRYRLSSPNKEEASNQNGFLYFRVNRKMVKVFLADILYIESVKDYIKIFRLNQPELLIRQSIAVVEAMLPSTSFVRVHRSFIVSLSRVTAFTSRDVEI